MQPSCYEEYMKETTASVLEKIMQRLLFRGILSGP